MPEPTNQAGGGTPNYWFARRFPVGDRRKSMVPISREGRLVTLAFVASTVLGGVAFIAMAVSGELILGAATLGVVAGLGGLGFISAADARGDNNHTAEDYSSGRAGVGHQPGGST